MIYSVDAALSRYHAHASGGFLVLLDITPSQDMIDEGIAREVINKIQKLRKKVIIIMIVGYYFICYKYVCVHRLVFNRQIKLMSFIKLVGVKKDWIHY